MSTVHRVAQTTGHCHADQKVLNISQGSVATLLMFGNIIFNDDLITNLLLTLCGRHFSERVRHVLSPIRLSPVCL